MCSSDVLLHRTVALLLGWDYPLAWASCIQQVKARAIDRANALTPRQRFRQLEPSSVFSGQTTSLSISEAEKELVKEVFGGIGCRIPAGTERYYAETGSGPRMQAFRASKVGWIVSNSTQWIKKRSIVGKLQSPPAEYSKCGMELDSLLRAFIG